MSKKKTCFVVGPFGRRGSEARVHADKLLKLIIRPTFRMHFKDFELIRADQMNKPGMIDSQVISLLIEADLVVADLTFRNANAFYELGIRHMIQKPVIHVFRQGEEVPFDVLPYRALEFAYDHKTDITDAKKDLRKAVAAILERGFTVTNPVTRSDGMLALRNRHDQAIKDSIEAVEQLRTMISFLIGRHSVIANGDGENDRTEDTLRRLKQAQNFCEDINNQIMKIEIW